MGERIAASIQFGGKISRALVPELIKLIEAEGLTEDFDESNGPDEDNLDSIFGDYQVNYGNLDDLTAFAVEYGLHYKHWYDSGPDWLAITEIYNPETDSTSELVGSDAAPSMNLSQILRLGSIEAIETYFAKFSDPLPPLEIVE